MYFVIQQWSLCTSVLLLLNYVRNVACASRTELSLTAPVSPVEQGGIFAFRCQVWNVKPNQEVTLIRERDKRRIFLNDILHLIEDRVFLALRQMGDGSTVYFLTIMEVRREDEGEYNCKITDTDGIRISDQSVTLQTLYFPPESDLKCGLSKVADDRPIYAGDLIQMNCTSSVGNPKVEIQWHGSNSKEILTSVKENRQDNTLTSVLNLRVSLQHSGVIFMCKISSLRAFPGKTQSCHVGPFVVLRNPAGSSRPTATLHHDFINTDVAVTFNTTNCEKQCTFWQSPVVFWIVSTIASIILAFVFLIIVLVLFLKYRNLPATRKYTGVPMGKVYDDLQRRQVDDRVYMSLVKLKRQNEDENLPYRHTMGRYDAP